MESVMGKKYRVAAAKQAVLALSEIKASLEAFERGETNVFDALDGIVIAVEAYMDAYEDKREAA